MTSSQGIFHYTQENILYAALYGSRTNYEQVILNYHGVETNPAIVINGGMWKDAQKPGLMYGDMWLPFGNLYSVGSH